VARGFLRILLILLLIGAVAGGWLWWKSRVPAAGPLRLTPVSFADLPGWRDSDPRGAFAAFRRSCAKLESQPATQAMGGVGYAGTVGDWKGICEAAPSSISTAQSARRFFEVWFTPVAVGAGGSAQALFTGYYEPELHASRTRHGPYQTPIYGLPDDLVTVDLGLFRDALKNEHIAGRIEGHSLVPYVTRGEIDAQGLSHAPVLFYADDPVLVFFLHIQGSGRVRLENGSLLRLAFAGTNGRPYTAIGRTLIDEGALPADGMSLQVIRAWMKAHPERARAVMESDASFVFFSEAPLGDASLGSPGSEGVALTPGASLAVDYRIHPLGIPFYVAAEAPLDRLMIAQDTGGAIRGALRGDVFWGFGEHAQSVAGGMKSHGALFVLLPKPLAARLAPHTDFSGSPPRTAP
jgi:membrane-bound lytic murein transglycosylase A